MPDYTIKELTETLRAIDSIIQKCEKAREKFPEGNSHHSLLCNRLKAMYISKTLVEEKLLAMEAGPKLPSLESEKCNAKELYSHLAFLHTTDLGAQRIRKNLCLNTDDVVSWCKEKIKSSGAVIMRKGKNWYIAIEGCEITVNAQSYTIITAHKKNRKRGLE